MSAELIALFARSALAASAAIVVVLAMRIPLRAVFGANVAYAFWAIVPIATLASWLPARRVFVDIVSEPSAVLVDASTSAVAPEAVASSALPTPIEAISAAPPHVSLLIIAAWALGFGVSLAFLVHGQTRFLGGVRLRRGEGDVRVAESDLVGPAVFGVVAPRIVVPADFNARYTERERTLVLAHERSHIRAGDVQVNALAAFTQCVMWFNPLAYMARAALRIDQELACDERVMRRHAGARRIYAEAMLKTQLAARPVPLGCAWPPVGANPLKQRIAMLGRPRLGRGRRALGAFLCATTIAAAGIAVWIAQPPQLAYAQQRPSGGWLRSSGARLVDALMQGDTAYARELIAAGADVNHWTPGDGTPLIMAVRLDDLEMARDLVAAGAEVNQPARGEGNALIVASARGNIEMARLFVGAGADVNAVVPGDETPLINAARNNQIEVARYLIDHGADVNLAVRAPIVDGSEMRSPLSMALRGRHAEMAALLRGAGAHD